MRFPPLGIAAAALIAATAAAPAPAQPGLPNPILHLTGQEFYSTSSGNFVRFRYDVSNKDAYPAEMFAAAPDLPPCGTNKNASRSWVDFFDRNGRRLYGFCAIARPQDLGTIWFAVPEGQVPPSYVYIVITDRRTNRTYRSNLAETTP